jgi:sugar/nucleoside kinase (ribokinase family)
MLRPVFNQCLVMLKGGLESLISRFSSVQNSQIGLLFLITWIILQNASAQTAALCAAPRSICCAAITNDTTGINNKAMNMPLNAVVAGHICLDIIPEMGSLPVDSFREAFRPGRLIEVGSAAMSTGGPVSNTGLALHRLGIPTHLIGKVGADPFGRIVRSLVESYGPYLAEGMVADAQTSTSYSVIIAPPSMDRTILHDPGANHTFSADDVDYELVKRAALFHFGYPPVMRRMYAFNGRGLVELFRRVKQTGVTTSLDMCYPDPASEGGRADWVAILDATLPFVDVFLPSVEELLFMLRRADFEAMTRRGPMLEQVTPAMLHDLSDDILRMGVRLLLIKLGERGLYLRTAGKNALDDMGRACPTDQVSWAEKEIWAPCFRVRVVGTTGAGDATIAGFLSALLRGMDPEDAVTVAVAVGACNVEAADALSGLRSWEDTLRRVRAGWERLPLTLDDPAWQWDASRFLYRSQHDR